MRAPIPPSSRHNAKVYGFQTHRVHVKAWSYAYPRSREIYVAVKRDGEHIATVLRSDS